MNEHQIQIAKLLLLTYGNKFTRVDYIALRDQYLHTWVGRNVSQHTLVSLLDEYKLSWSNHVGFVDFCQYIDNDYWKIQDKYLKLL